MPQIVLINTSHAGNIGATARAMKTMGFTTLILVQPKNFPHPDADAMAAGAKDTLANCLLAPNLEAALNNSQLVFGASARKRQLNLPILTPREAATLIREMSQTNTISILFGRENNGLVNEELAHCHYQIKIPTSPTFSSLNLAAAVQLICYEISITWLEESRPSRSYSTLATGREVVALYRRLYHTLARLEFFYHENSRRIMAKLTAIFNRTQLNKNELNLLHGILSSINKLDQR